MRHNCCGCLIFLPDTYLYVKDIDGRFVAMNETQVRMKEVKDQSELWGKTDLDLHSLHWGRLYQQEDRKVMESGRELPDQIWLVSTADGSLGTFCSSKIPATRYADPLEVRDVAARVGLSTSQLNRRFRSAFQMPPSEYLQRVRVHEASRRLVDGDGPISDIALECGFYDQAHLTRTFRRWMGMTPKDFRRLSQ
jgi:AraC-like DNA-binding protein